MSFDEVRLPEDIESGARGGAGFSTSIASLKSGSEKRNVNWTRERSVWNIAYGIQDKEGYQAVMDFFRIRQGRAYGFRFKDWSDYELVTELIGTGDGSETQFQIIKTYSDSARSYERPIQKPVAGTFQVLVNSALLTETTDYTVDTTTGVITFTSAPGNGENIEVTCEFDVPVRFDVDQIELSLEYIEAGGIGNIPVIELKQDLALA